MNKPHTFLSVLRQPVEKDKILGRYEEGEMEVVGLYNIGLPTKYRTVVTGTGHDCGVSNDWDCLGGSAADDATAEIWETILEENPDPTTHLRELIERRNLLWEEMKVNPVPETDLRLYGNLAHEIADEAAKLFGLRTMEEEAA